VVLEFLELYLSDQAGGRKQTLIQYLQRFPGHEEAIAREYLSFTGGQARGESPEAGAGGAGGEDRLGPYRLLSELGRGGQAVVYLAEDTRLGRKVALKVLSAPFGGESGAALPARFRREAEAASRLDHPGICQVFEAGLFEGRACLAMRLIEGRTLAQMFADRTPAALRGTERQRRMIQIVELVARALQVAHDAGIVHRDVKPANIMLRADGEPVILDFGIARDDESDLSLTRTGDLFGTPHYMSPEQLSSGRWRIDAGTDVWSLGVVLFEGLTGERPFEAPTRDGLIHAILNEPPRDLRKRTPGLSGDLSVVLATALEKDPAHRYQTALDLAEDLRRVRELEPIQARPAGALVRLDRFAKRNPALAASLAALLLTMTIGLIVTSWLWRSTASNLADVRRLSDLKVLEEARAHAERLWPAVPERLDGPDGMNAWLDRARDLLGRLDSHRDSLERLRRLASGQDPAGDGFVFEDASSRWWHQQLSALVAGLSDFSALITDVEARREFAETVERRTLLDYADEWRASIEAIADPERSPVYGGLRIEPILGLIPLGPDPRSGLFEFAHLQTGEPVLRDEATGELLPTEESGLVFVLIPGGRFRMGAIRPDEEHPPGSENVDPRAGKYERPVMELELDPFLLSKYEMTQGQWLRVTGDNPSGYQNLRGFQELEELLRHPVEEVSWFECETVLAHLGLRLPTEAQWEYAARAGTHTVFSTGDDPRTLEGFANLADASFKTRGGQASVIYEEWLVDGYPVHAPAGSFRPNAFGLFDVHGNVAEWVQDPWEDYAETPAREGDGLRWVDGREHRLTKGGSFSFDSSEARSAARGAYSPSQASASMGVRPALRVVPLQRAD